jgi:hypothetical protein
LRGVASDIFLPSLTDQADGGEGAGLQPTLMWFARRLNDPGLMSVFARQLAALIAGTPTPNSGESARFMTIAALWWTDADAVRALEYAIAGCGGG